MIIYRTLLHLQTCTEGVFLVHTESFLSVGVAMNMVGRDSLEATKSFFISVWSAAEK